MKQFCLLTAILFFIAACGTLPQLQHADSRMRPEGPPECRRQLLQGRWQFQYAIEATFPEEQKSVLIGVSVVSAESGSIHSVLMTIEGVVVFDARYDREIQILRAIRPFDTERFARGLLNDFRLVFFKPEGALIETGTLPNGSYVCRYQQPDRLVVDIVGYSDHHWQVQQYGRWFTEKRMADIFFNDNFRFDGFHAPSRLKLTVSGYAGYTLDMDLIEAVSLKDQQ